MAALCSCCLQVLAAIQVCRKSHLKKKIALDNLKIKSPVEHLWIWKETPQCTQFTEWVLPLLAYLLPSHAKHVPAGDKDTVDANQSPGHSTATHPGLGLGVYSCSCAAPSAPQVLPYPLFYPEAAAATQWTPNHIIFSCPDTGLHWKQRAETKQPKMLEARTVYAGKCCLCCTPVDMHMENPSRIRMTL